MLRPRFWIVLVGLMALGYGAFGQFSPYLYRVEGQYFDSDGVRIHYTDQGQGEPVILLHGYAMNIDISWRNNGVIDALAENYRVIGMDFRGHGLSGKPHDVDAYGTEVAKDVLRLMDHLEIEKAHLVGNSMGAFVALHLAIHYPERFRSAAPCGLPWPVREGRNLETLYDLAESLKNDQSFAPLIDRLQPDEDAPNWLLVSAVDTVVGYLNDTEALRALTLGIVELTLTREELRHNTVPTLSIVGENDPLLADTRRVKAVMPHHRVKVVEGAHHFNLPSSDGFIPMLAEFLAQHGPQPAGTVMARIL